MTVNENPWWALARAFGNMGTKQCYKCGRAIDNSEAVEIKKTIGEALELSWICIKCHNNQETYA